MNASVLTRYIVGASARSISSGERIARTCASTRATWRRFTPDLTASSQAARTRRCASGLPTCGASAIASDSAMISPPVSSRFAFMRAGSTWRLPTAPRTCSTAPAVKRNSSGIAAHSACHPPAARSCSCAIADRITGATPWHGQRSLPVLAQRMHLAHRQGQPPRSLEAEGDRQRLLEQRPPGHQRMAVLPGERRARCAYAKQSVHEEIEPVPRLQHQRRIDCILARGSPMDEPFCITLDPGRQHSYKGDRGCAGHRRLTVQGRYIEQFLPAIGRDDGCCLLWDDAGASFRACQGCLKSEHAPHMRLGGEGGGHSRRAEQEVTRLRHVALLHQTLKNAVSPAPCSTISKRW